MGISKDMLVSDNWIYFKLYEKTRETPSWKVSLDWYHNVLREIVRPLVMDSDTIRIVFFNFYGLSSYSVENGNKYERRIQSPDRNLVYIRLRLYAGKAAKLTIRKELEARLRSRNDLVWDHEILKEFKVQEDLGGRFGRRSDGSIDDNLTLCFVHYLDSACRYILSILVEQDNWEKNVDVMGIPHLVNNALGAWLRHPNSVCPKCQATMYVATFVTPLSRREQAALSEADSIPVFRMVCPRSHGEALCVTNI
jgi:hypothetical protein